MNTKNILFLFVFALASIFCFNACEKEKNYPVKEVDTEGTIGLTYQKLTSYPVLDTIKTQEPVFNLSGQYKFTVSEIKTLEGIIANEDLFSVDASNGVIIIDNTSGALNVATYQVFISVLTLNGLVNFSDSAVIEITDAPIELSYNQTSVDASFFEQGEMGVPQVTHTDGGSFEYITYELIDPPAEGVSINDSTGIISKGIGLPTGPTRLSVKVITNLGVKSFEDIFTINVGAEPTISYPGAGGTLSTVTVSPWSGYTSQAPVLVGMNADGGYTLDVSPTITGSLSISNTGVISIAADANFPSGTYSVNVSATNGDGITVNFNDVFNISIEERWETIVSGDFDGLAATEPNFANFPQYTNYFIGGSTPAGEWQPARLDNKSFIGMRRFNPGTDDACAVREITGIDATMKRMRASFNELFGYNDNFVNVTYDRAFYFGYDVTTIATGVFNSSEWPTLIGTTDARWNTVNGWGTGAQTTYANIEIPFDNSNSTIYLNWRLFSKAAGSQNGQYCITAIIVEVAKAYTAEETVAK